MRNPLFTLALAPLTCLAIACPVASGDFVWSGSGPAPGWSDTANWLENGSPTDNVPGCNGLITANVTIPSGFSDILVVCANGGNVHLNSLQSESLLLINSTLTLDSPSSITDPISMPLFNLVMDTTLEIKGINGVWDKGTIRGGGVVVNSNTFTIDGITPLSLKTHLNNNGTIYQNAGLTLQPDTVARGADPVITSSEQWLGSATIGQTTSPGSSFDLSGGEVQSLGALRFTLPMNITGAGVTVYASEGNVRISGGGVHGGSGQYLADKGREIIIDAISGSTPMQIAGVFTASGEGALRLNRELLIESGGSLKTNFAGGEGFVFDNGSVLTLQGAFHNTGAMMWKAGGFNATFAGATDHHNQAGGTVKLVGGGSSTPTINNNSAFTNAGTWRHEADCMINPNAQLVTRAGGTFELRSSRVLGAGIFKVENSGLLLRPIDSPPGFGEVVAACNLDNAQVISETGEIRFSGGGLWNDSTLEAQQNAQITLRNLEYWIPSNGPVTFSGAGEVHVRSGAVLRCTQFGTNTLGQGGGGGLFRLGTDGTGGTISGGGFRNQGEFRWRSGNIGLLPSDLFSNLGVFRTEAANNSIKGQLANFIESDAESNATGSIFIDHHVQVQPDARLANVGGGLITQTNATVTLVSANSFGILLGGTWKLIGTSNINGIGQFRVLGNGAKLLKQGAGTTSTISSQFNVFDLQGSAGRVTVESGRLVISSPIGGEHGVFWSIGPGASLNLAGQTYTTGQDPNSSLADEIEGVVSLALGPLPPPRFECGTLNNGGYIRPGGVDDTAELVIDANVNLLSDGIVFINVAGPSPRSSHDLLTIEGNLTLGGTLHINLLDDYVPAVGQQFTIGAATGTISGGFDQIIGDGTWSAQTVGSTIVVTMQTQPTCGPDITCDGVVNVNDLLMVINGWGPCPPAPQACPADIAPAPGGDDVVNVNDLLMVINNWG